MQGEYVIQFHQGGKGADHYDLMLDVGRALRTFQLPKLPGQLRTDEHVDVRPLPDHRGAYLTYEGPVGDGRGSVSIAEKGTYDAPVVEVDRWMMDLSGALTCGRFELYRRPDGRWRLKRLPQPG